MSINNPLEYPNTINLAKELITFKSITPHDSGCLEYIQTYLANLGFEFIRLDKNNTSNLVATYGNPHNPNIPVVGFAGHVDVVPTGDINKWKYHPFTLTEQDDLLYGRGISDMKGAIAAFLVALTKLINHTNISSQITIMFLLTSDEEGSGTFGTPVIVEYLKTQNIRLNYCLVGEPTSVNLVGDIIKIGRRGSLNTHLEIIGKQGHVAYPHLCTNPINAFSNALNELVNTKWDDGTEYFPPTSLQFTNLNSGLGVDNVIPQNLYAKFNIRYNNLHTPEKLENKIITILDKYQLKYQIKFCNSALPFISKQAELAKIAIESVNLITKNTPQLTTDGGTSDARFLIEISDEILELGLTNQTIHQINEHIHKNELSMLTEIYHHILSSILNLGGYSQTIPQYSTKGS